MFSFIFFLLSKIACANTNEIFDRLMTHSRIQSSELRAAEELAAEKSAAVYHALTFFGPRADLILSRMRSLDNSILTSGTFGSLSSQFKPQTTDLARWEVQIAMPLYRRSAHLGLLNAFYERDLGQLEYADKSKELEWKLRQLFGNYLLQIYTSRVLINQTELAQKNLQEAQLRFELGQRTRVDVLKAQGNLSSLQTRALEQKTSLMRARHELLDYTSTRDEDTLAQLKNLAEYDESTIRRDIETFVGNESILSAEKVSDLSQAPTIRKVQINEELARNRASEILSADWPELKLFANFFNQGDSWSEALTTDNHSYSLGVSLKIPLFSSGSTIAGYSVAKHARARAEISRAREAFRFYDRMDQELQTLEALAKSVESRKLLVLRNLELENLSFRSYQLGKLSFQELLSSQTEHLESKVELARSQIELAVQMRRYKWLAGF